MESRTFIDESIIFIFNRLEINTNRKISNNFKWLLI